MIKRTFLKSAVVVVIGTLTFPMITSAQEDPPAEPSAAANTYGSVEPIPNPDVIDTGPLRDQSLAVKEAFAERVFECGAVDEVIDALVSSAAITTIDGLNTSFDVAAGGFAGNTNPAFVYLVVDSGPNAASTADVNTLTNSLGYVLSQGSAFLLDGDDPDTFDFPANYVVLNFDAPPTMEESAALFETVGKIDPELFKTDTSGYTQYGRAYLSLQSNVPDEQFIAGYVEAAAEAGVVYTPVRGGVPGLFEGGAAFPGNDWNANRAGEEYLARIPAASHDALEEIRDDHLRTTRDALRIVDHWGRHGDRFEDRMIRALDRLRCRY